jgi:tRNA threonylcarbamoyladenosine biosynthesis protein TsaE
MPVSSDSGRVGRPFPPKARQAVVSVTSDTQLQRQSEPHACAELRSDSPDETRRLGALLGALLRPGDVVLLQGNLGAGKTAFAQGIARGLEVTGTVNSPTFTILKEYAGRLPLYHFDLYRIDDPDELPALGFEQYFDGDGDGVCVVEWAERGETAGLDGDASLGELWPEDWLRIEIVQLGGDARLLRVAASGVGGKALLSGLRDTADATCAPGATGAE